MKAKLLVSFLHEGKEYNLVAAGNSELMSISVINTTAPYCFAINHNIVTTLHNFCGPLGAFIKNDHNSGIKDSRRK